MYPAVMYARMMLQKSAPILKGLAFSSLFIIGGVLASPFVLGALAYIGWKTGTDPTFHYSKLMGKSRENVDTIKCNVLKLIESVKRLEMDLCNSDSESMSHMDLDSSVGSSPFPNYDSKDTVKSANAHVFQYDEDTHNNFESRLPKSVEAKTIFGHGDDWFESVDSPDENKKAM